MSIVLTPTTPEQLAKIIAFLDDNHIHSHIPVDYNPMESEDLFTNNQEQIEALVVAVQQKGLASKETIERGGWDCYVSKESTHYKYTWYKPTAAFKSFCGSEFCNPIGQITLDMAEAVVVLHAKARSGAISSQHSGAISSHITLSDELRDVLETNASKLSLLELRQRFVELFTPVA